MDVLERVLSRAAEDAGVVGVILTGSRARGLQTARSDYDVTVVVAQQAEPWRHHTRTDLLDEVVCTVDGLADTSVHWRRYGYRGAQVLLDRLDGGIADLVDAQARFTADEASAHARDHLDAYVNQVYRCVKSRRDGAADAALLDERESVPWLLETVFALHGRLRPYNRYLRWELDTFPLPEPWHVALMPGPVGTAALRLFPAVESLARQRGHGDILDGWGRDIDLIRTFAAGPRP